LITPTQRCVLLMAAGGAPALLIGVFAPGLWYAGLVWIPAVLSLLLMDWLFAAWKPEVAVQAPGAVEIGAPLIVDIEINPRRSWPTALELAIGTGPRLRPAADDRVMPKPGETQIAMAFNTVRRGTDGIEKLWIRWTGPLGLARIQRVREIGHGVMITPDIRLVRDKAQLLLRDAQAGEMARIDRGEGSEFESLTEWRSGMDRRTIDWNHSARHMTLLARELRIERNNQIVFAVDSGRVMCEPIDGLPRIDRAISAALLAAFAALKLGDRVALYGFDSKPRISSGTVSGPRAFPLMQRLAAELDYSTTETNFTLGLATLAGGLTRRSLIIVFTEFTDQTAAELMIRAATNLLGRHLILFVVLADTELEEMTEAEPLDIDDVSRAVTAAGIQRERRIVMSRLRHLGIHVLEARHDRVGPALVRQYLEFKRRNLL
jgi:uncharacterized protein (DUF58 family)